MSYTILRLTQLFIVLSLFKMLLNEYENVFGGVAEAALLFVEHGFLNIF